MSDILVSIIESVADAAAAAKARRDAAQAQSSPPAVPQSIVRRFQEDAPPQPIEAASAPMEQIAVAQPSPGDAAQPRRTALRRMFATPQRLVSTVIASEILGPPLALRRHNLWDPPGV